MATKPSVFPTWNTGGANRSTPPGAKLTLGHEASEEPSSSYENWWKHYTGVVHAWIEDGSNAAGTDAHIVETDEDGQVNLAYLQVARPDELRLNDGLQPVPGIVVTTARANSVAIHATGGDGGAAGYAGVFIGGDGAAGINASSPAASDQPGIVTTGGGDGPGLEGVGGETGGDGVVGTGTGSGAGVVGTGGDVGGAYVIGGGGGTGVRGTGGPDGGVGGWFVPTGAEPAVLGAGSSDAASTGGRFSPGHVDAFGLEAYSHASGSTTGAAVRAYAREHATALWGSAGTGTSYALRLEPNAAAGRCHMRLVGLTSIPSGGSDGDFGFINNSPDVGLLLRHESGWVRPHHSAGGFLDNCGVIEALAGTTNSSASPVARVTVSSVASQIRMAGEVTITAIAEVSHTNAGAVGIQIWDATAGVEVGLLEVNCRESGVNADERMAVLRRNYDLPASGARTFQLRYWEIGGGTAHIREASLRVEGIY